MANAVDPNLQKARDDFADFETATVFHTTGMIDNIIDEIRDHLIVVGKDASALDETGQSTEQEMEDRITAAKARAHLVIAREKFADYETRTVFRTTGIIYYIVDGIREHLNHAGRDVSALDETGQSTEQEMEDRITAAKARAHLVIARKKFVDFETGTVSYATGLIDYIVDGIREHLNLAGKDISALDETGRSTEQEMEKRLADAVTAAKQQCAPTVSLSSQASGGSLSQQSQGVFPKDATTDEPVEEQKPENPDRALGDRAYEAMKGLVR